MKALSVSAGMLVRWMARMKGDGMRWCPKHEIFIEENPRNGVGMYATLDTIEALVEMGHVEMLDEDGDKIARASAAVRERFEQEAKDLI